jgi:hypothetical protein
METETNKLREDLISMLKDVCFDKPDEKIFELKVLVYKDASGGAPGDDGAVGDDDSVDGDSVDGDSDDDASVASDDDGPKPHPITGIGADDVDVDVDVIKTPYEELLEFKLFQEICEILGGKPEELYSQKHFDFYNDENYDAQFKGRNDELLDMYETVDTMMVGLPYEIIYSDDDQLNKK